MCFTIPEQKDKSLFIPCSCLLDRWNPRHIQYFGPVSLVQLDGAAGLLKCFLPTLNSTAQGAFRVLRVVLGPFPGRAGRETSLKEDVLCLIFPRFIAQPLVLTGLPVFSRTFRLLRRQLIRPTTSSALVMMSTASPWPLPVSDRMISTSN